MTTSSYLNLPTFNGEKYEEPKPILETGKHIGGSYTLRTLNITLKNGSVIELAGVFTELEVFEDVFKYSIEGRLRIRDYVGGFEKFIITGGEKLQVIALKPNGNNETLISRNDLVVTRISQMAFQQNNFVMYDLFFSSMATVNSIKTKIFKGYNNDRSLLSVTKKLYSEVTDISNLYLNTFNTDVNLANPYIATGLRPLEAINQLVKRASTTKDYYLFFEKFAKNTDSPYTHKLLKWNAIKEGQATIPKIVFNPQVSQVSYNNQTENDTNINASFIRIEPNFDHIANIKSGFYNSRIRTLDPLTRTYSDSIINYKNESEDNLKTIYDNKFIENNSVFTNFNETTIERLIVSSRNDSITNKAEWLKYDTYGAVLNTVVRMTVQVYGGSNKLECGVLIDLSMPSQANRNSDASVRHENQIYSGKYMITAVKHNLSPKVYMKTLELGRGSLRFDIDTLISNYPSGNQETVTNGSPITTTVETR